MGDTHFIVAAIDFGTTYSGYAFQLTQDYDSKNPTLKIMSPQAWNGGRTQLTSMKTPTCLLLDNNGDLDCFGYEAEDRYADLCLDNDHGNWYYFRRFKMRLHDSSGLGTHTEIADESGRRLPAIKVFSRSIEALTGHLFKLLEDKSISVKPTEIKWLLTVPAIWDDTAKGFMREAAKRAGIPSENLTICLEPEAASLFCQYLPVEKFSMCGEKGFSDSKPGTTYMIVDLGGGTADITVHEKVSAGNLKEVHRASGGPWGGTFVDSEFIQLISSIVGGPIMAAFMKEQKYDYLELMREFEAVKRKIGLGTKDTINMKLPVSLNETCLKVVKKDLKQLIKDARKDKQITFVSDKAKFDAKLLQGCFRKATDKIVSHMKGIFEKEPCGKKISMILMVGGFSESPFVHDVIKDAFGNKAGLSILIPNDAGISVVQGAVVYGRQPKTITSRILRFTYGVKVSPEFVQGKHDPKRHTVLDGVERCDGCFFKFIDIGTTVEIGHKVTEKYKNTVANSTLVTVEVFTADETNSSPTYVDEHGCRSIGSLDVFFFT
ncbi:hypothetical protein DPMN_057508 [Dreissena polymorpha]|uniref:Uncharacterized protein n=1 Tax=Dreissena polymorpha TaxID=45954 RepID=A0A9D4C039_DREPO|nr:hypothetical protein DPMN_057508 [Dreissena polymorpha]